MTPTQLTALATIFACLVSCADNSDKETANSTETKAAVIASTPVTSDSFETGKLITPVFCKSNSTQSYALYIPLKRGSEALPVIYFFDPHANGALPLTKYKALADRYGFILVGSNNSKNGNSPQTTENICNILFDDVKNRLKINVNRVYTAGFSGGAKVASYAAMSHREVKGVLAGGAGLPDETTPASFPFSFTAIAGQGDMNMTDLVALNAALDKTQTRHRIIFFDGKHEWAPENIMSIAFAGLQFDAMSQNTLPADDAFRANYIADSKKRITLFLKADNYIKAEAECRLSIELLGKTPGAAWFTEKEAALKRDPVYQKQSQARQNLLADEQNLKAAYSQQFQQGDMNYWMTTIHELQAKANPATAVGAMYERLQAYLSLAFYSISNQLIAANRDTDAQHFVELYKADDAANPEAWYFSAILNARNKNITAAKDDLLKAVVNGYTDRNRMRQQPEFQNLQINFAEIENKMKPE